MKNHTLSNSLPPAGERTKENIPLSCSAGEGRGEGEQWKEKRQASAVRAKSLRQIQTDAEKEYWHEVRAKRFQGLKFKRQYSIGPYFADFVCIEEKLIVEIDGGQHCENTKDEIRTCFLEKEGFQVIRFWNNEVMDNMEGVLATLSLTLSRQRERGQRENCK